MRSFEHILQLINLRLVSLLIVLVLCTQTSCEPGYLKFCGDEEKASVYSTSCSKGLWLNAPVNPGCVCATGVWALSDGLCDKMTAVIVGHHHCFHVGFDVRAVKFIGNPLDPFEPSIYTASSGFDAIHQVPETGLSETIRSDRSYVIGINPNRPVERSDHTVCIQASEESKWKPVHVYANPSRSSNKWHFGTRAKCGDPSDYSYHIGFGEMLRGSKVLAKELIGRDCQEKCPDSEPTTFRLGRAMKKNQGNKSQEATDISPSSRSTQDIIVPMNSTVDDNSGHDELPRPVHTNLAREPPQPKTGQEIAYEKEQARAQILIDLDDYHREINEQTLRMMHAQISPILLNVPGNEVGTREYAYFQKGRLVVEKLYPSEFVPENLMRGLMRMFKQLLWENTDHERPHSQGADDAQFDRIMNILDNCTGNITQMDRFVFYNYTGSFNFTGKNETDSDWPKPEQCPEPLIYGVWGKNHDGEYTVLHNVTGGFQGYLKFNLSLVDFVIETAWKTVMIAHYQCSKSFNDTTASDFARFFHQMELFFNDKIVKRWYDPINVNNTLRILELIFPTYDLKKFAFGIDICLFAAQQYTDYGWNSKWIQRPKIPFTANELSQDIYYIPGLGRPISTNDYAPKIQRKKRDVSMMMLDGKANCMNKNLDPVQKFAYVPRPGCILEKS